MLGIAPLPLHIALLGDHAVVRFGLAERLKREPDPRIVGGYDSGRSMIVGLQAQPADVLLIDYSLGPGKIDGVSLIRALRTKFPESKVLVVSSHYDPATVALTLRAGACGFVGNSQGPGAGHPGRAQCGHGGHVRGCRNALPAVRGHGARSIR